MRTGSRFRPMGISDILDETSEIYKDGFLLLIGIAAMAYIPYVLLEVALGLPISSPSINLSTPFEQSLFSHFAKIGALMVFIFLVIMPGLAGTLAYAISQRYLGNRTTIIDSYKRILTRPVFFPLLGATLLRGTAILAVVFLFSLLMALSFMVLAGLDLHRSAGGALALTIIALVSITSEIIGIAFVWTRLSLAEMAIVVESQGAKRSLARSMSLTSGFFWKGLGLYLLVYIVIIVITGIVAGPVQMAVFVKAASKEAFSPTLIGLNLVISTLVSIITAPAASIAAVLFYYDLRIRKEGFDLQMLAQDLKQNRQTKDEKSGPIV